MHNLKLNFFKYTTLNIIGAISLACYILADTFFVSKLLGSVGLASLNFAISIFSVMLGLGLLVGIGGGTDFSIQHQHKTLKNTAFTHSVLIGAVFAIILMIIGIFFSTPLSAALGATGEALPLTQTYLSTVLTFAPFFIFNNILLGFLRNDNAPRLAMIAMLISNIFNIILDYVFMFTFNMGMFGAAFATCLSPIISILILSLHFIRKKNAFHLCKCKITLSEILRIMSLGFSSFICELASAVSLVTFNLIIFNIAGNTGVAAYGIIANIAIVATAIFVGISQGMQPLASKLSQDNNKKPLHIILRYSITLSLAFSVALYGIVFIFSKEIIAAFNSYNNTQLAQLTANGINIYFVGYLFAGINIVCSAFLSAIAKPKKGILISLFRSCLFLVPIAFILSFMFKLNGVWLSFVVCEFLVAIITARFIAKSIK